MSEGLRFFSFKHLWSKNFTSFTSFFSAGLSLFAFPSFNKWWWWCRVDGDTVKRTYVVFAGKKNEVKQIFCCLTSNPSFSNPSLAAGESTPSVTPLHLHRKTLAGLPALPGEPKELTRITGKFKAIYRIFLEGMVKFSFKTRTCWGYNRMWGENMNRTTNCFQWRITTSYHKNPNTTNPSVWTDPRYPTASPKNQQNNRSATGKLNKKPQQFIFSCQGVPWLNLVWGKGSSQKRTYFYKMGPYEL